jgi:RNA polymerase sigma factor (sigma-70 family)
VKKERGLAATEGVVSESTAKAPEGSQKPQEGFDEATKAQRAEAAERLIESHDAVFRRTARRYSICTDDAEDAYQRSLEILLTKAPPLEGDSMVRWMQVVTKREALAVRRQRERLLIGGHPADPEDDRDLFDTIPSDSDGPIERAASRERVARSKEALRSLKPQETRALTLKAQGYSYSEIGEITGWTYTKINRCMAEGRKRFLSAFADIEEGRRCEELATALSALADGERDVVGADEVGVHLRSCATCRAKLRAFRAIPDRVLELFPSGPAVDHTTGGRAHEWIVDRFGSAVDKVRESAYSLAHRGGASEGEAAAGGLTSGLQASATKALAICGVAVAGSGGAYCAVNGVTPGDLMSGRDEPEKVVEEEPAVPDPSLNPSGATRPVTVPTESSPEESAPEQEPLTEAQQTGKELGFEQASPSSSSSSSSGGGEFGSPSGGASGGSAGGGSSGGFGFE